MSAGDGRKRRGSGRRGHGGGHEEGTHADERWLITYADMITLLMALFIVLYAMSTVDASKLKALSASLDNAFSHILPGSKGVAPSTPVHKAAPPSEAPVAPITPSVKTDPGEAAKQAADDEQFAEIKKRIDQYAVDHNIQDKLHTRIDSRGLVVTLLADNVLFGSGSATLGGGALPMLRQVGAAVRSATSSHPVSVEGHTDDMPTRGSTYPTNWELSTARASSVVRYLISSGMPAARLSAAGYADLHPRVPNTNAANRARNRRVDIVLLRRSAATNGA